MKKLYYMCTLKVVFVISYLKYICHRLSYLVVIFVLCSCWPCCERRYAGIKPIQKDYKGQLKEYDSLLKEIPSNIRSLPILILGQDPGWRDIGCIVPKPQDITLDNSHKTEADIKGDVWDTDTITKIKAHPNYQGSFSAIVFERIGVLPLYWGKYLQAFVAQPTNDIYQFPDDMNNVVDLDACRAHGLNNNRANRKKFYSKGLSIFHELKLIPVSALQPFNALQVNLGVDPQLVTLENPPQGSSKEGGEPTILQLEQVLTSIAPPENTILRDYYELLAPGGLLIFSSSANGINRYGLVVDYQGKKYTPFQDLDDLRLQAVYRSIFERAGFVNIQFYKDPYFAEEVMLLVAQKL